MHIGRSRNDMGHAQRRIYLRDQTERLIGAVIEFQRQLIEKAEENVDTLMPGYTHIRQAQPVTLAHYILAHVEAAARTVERLEGVYSRANLSTMGAAAFAGTSWDVDRNRVMELLGFDALLENTTDAVATTDYAIELASAIAIHMTQIRPPRRGPPDMEQRRVQHDRPRRGIRGDEQHNAPEEEPPRVRVHQGLLSRVDRQPRHRRRLRQGDHLHEHRRPSPPGTRRPRHGGREHQGDGGRRRHPHTQARRDAEEPERRLHNGDRPRRHPRQEPRPQLPPGPRHHSRGRCEGPRGGKDG